MYGFEILREVDENCIISMNDTYKVNDIAGVCYAILETITQILNYPIKRCQNCGMYFIPSKRLDEIYCDYPKKIGKTCRKQGAISAHNKRLQDKSAYIEYRKLYQQKFAFTNKNKDNKKIKKDFENLRKLAKGKISDLKHGKLSEDVVYKWLGENKTHPNGRCVFENTTHMTGGIYSFSIWMVSTPTPHGWGVYPQAAAGFPFTAAVLAVKGDPIADLQEDLAADKKGKRCNA